MCGDMRNKIYGLHSGDSPSRFIRLLIRIDLIVGQMRSSLDHRALGLLTAPEHQGKPYSSTLVGCCVATLAFTHVILRSFHPTCKTLKHFSQALGSYNDCLLVDC